jgi:hypothetical protein
VCSLAESGNRWKVLEAVRVCDKAHWTKRTGQTITLSIKRSLFAFLDTTEHVRLSLFGPAVVIIQLVVEA